MAGERDLGVGAETRYAVAVQRVFKGDLTGTVVVNQQGGRDAAGEVVDLPEGDRLLRAGQRYLFATEYHPDHRFHTVIPRPRRPARSRRGSPGARRRGRER